MLCRDFSVAAGLCVSLSLDLSSAQKPLQVSPGGWGFSGGLQRGGGGGGDVLTTF